MIDTIDFCTQAAIGQALVDLNFRLANILQNKLKQKFF